MIPFLHDLIASLSRDLTVAELTDHLGPIASDPGPPRPAELKPKNTAFRRVIIGRYAEGGKPYTVELELRAAISVAALTAAFGSYTQTRSDRGQLRKISFSPAGSAGPAGGSPWKVSLIAQVPSGMWRIEEAEATRLVLRRDPA